MSKTKTPLTPEELYDFQKRMFFEDDPRFKTVEEIDMLLKRTKTVLYNETYEDIGKIEDFLESWAKFNNMYTAFKYFYPREDYDYYLKRPAKEWEIPVYYDQSTMYYMLVKRNKAFFIDNKKEWFMCYGKRGKRKEEM